MFCFIGPPCCGKGTQGVLFQKECNYSVFSVGEFLRDRADQPDDKGQKLSALLQQGNLISNEEIFDILNLRIFAQENLILDGFPRSVDQSIYFNSFLHKHDLTLDAIVVFLVSFEIALERMKRRVLCNVCKKNVVSPDALCQNCGSRDITRRVDDVESVFKKRFEEYTSSIEEVIHFHELKGVRCLKVDASAEDRVVFEKIKSLIVA